VLSSFLSDLYDQITDTITKYELGEITVSNILIPDNIVYPCLVLIPVKYYLHDNVGNWLNKPSIEIEFNYIDHISTTNTPNQIVDNAQNVFFHFYSPYDGWVKSHKLHRFVNMGEIDIDISDDQKIMWFSQRFLATLALGSGYKTATSKFLNSEST
jgi:hypothetical protein